MAKKSGKDKKTGKKGPRLGVKVWLNAQLREACPHVVNMVRPHDTGSSAQMAARLIAFDQAVIDWEATVRKHVKEVGSLKDAPAFPASKYPNPNTGVMSRTAWEKLVEVYNDSDARVVFPPRYNPIMVDVTRRMQALHVRRGSVSKHPKPPKDWDEGAYGSWFHEYKDDDGNDVKDPSGWFTDENLPRRSHARTAEKMVVDAGDNILTFGNNRYVVGKGTHAEAAVFLVRSHQGGNYGANDEIRKRLSLAGKPVTDVVFRIEDRPNNGDAFVMKGNWSEVDEVCFLPGQVMTPGHLCDGDKPLEAKAIRKLDADTKGLKFKPLSEPIVGKQVPWASIWTELQRIDKANLKAMRERGGRSAEYEAMIPQDKAITNIRVTCRVDPSEAYPFGFKAAQCGMVPFTVATGDGRIEDGAFEMGVVIGARSNTPYNVGVHAAKPEPRKPEPKEKKAKPKAEKKKAAKKAAKKKAVTAEKEPEQVALPVEEEVTVEATVGAADG